MSERAKILLADDDASLREVVTFHLGQAGWDVDAVANGQQALDIYDPSVHGVVVTDIRMPKMDGMALLEALHSRDPDAVVLIMTAYGGIERAIDAMRAGAFHYVEKPVNMKAFLALLRTAAEHRALRRENRTLTNSPQSDVVAASPAMNEVLRLVDKVADSDASILVLGESGTGKELVAQTIHERSPRRARPFVAVNCAAIPEDLLESVLFGHERGSFTGATRAAPGKFRTADGGTLFLDEVAEMSPRLQAKLLRVLQSGEIDVVGSDRPRQVDVRILAATHRDLPARVASGEFREDLYYRLNVVSLQVPPLRERPEDIPVLVRFFLRKHAPGRDIRVTEEVDSILASRDWPGNVRELENAVRRLLLLSDDDELTATDLPPELKSTESSGQLPFKLPEDSLDLFELERQIILAALDKKEGNQSATARYLNIPRHVLLYRLEKFGGDEEE